MSTVLETSSPASVLIAEDHDDTRTAMARILRSRGFQVWEAADGTEALQGALRKPALVLLDVRLPDIDGFTVCERIKSDPATANVPVLMISGTAVTAEDRIHGLEGGADAYLVKPVEPDELLAYVKALLRVHRAESALRESEHRLRLVMDALPVGVVVMDAAGNIVLHNAVSEQIWGGIKHSPAARYAESVGRWHDTGKKIQPDESGRDVEWHISAEMQHDIARCES